MWLKNTQQHNSNTWFMFEWERGLDLEFVCIFGGNNDQED